MIGTLRVLTPITAVALVALAAATRDAPDGNNVRVLVNPPAAHDVSPPLAELARTHNYAADDRKRNLDLPEPGPSRIDARWAEVEQTTMGTRPPIVLLESFDGHGVGLVGPHGIGRGNNPSDNSLAIGPNHIYETVNSLTAVYTKKGELFDNSGTVLFGPIGHNVVWNGFGGPCEASPNGDTVVRYDQLADRWVIVMPRFNRAPPPPGSPPGTLGVYGMCYAISTGPNPLGPYYRYYFERELFPDYPRPAIWIDGYYNPTSTGDNRLPDGSLPHKHACVLDRTTALQGGPATEQCIITRYTNFFNNTDIDGQNLPPHGAPNIIMATGGAQLDSIFHDDGIYYWKFHVDWKDPSKTRLDGPTKITVAPYNYLCNGQLTRCVPQQGSQMRIDAQGDKIMQRLVYRNIDGRESIVAVHSVNTTAGGGGVRWYEFGLDAQRNPVLRQQGTYAPDSNYRWMASPAIDRQGNIGIGYSFGGPNVFPGQRFAARLADDSLGQMTFAETVMVHGQAASPVMRWQDYTTTAMDPSDDCTMWYQGDYVRAGATSYTVKIGAFRVPGCLRGTVSGSAFYDNNRNGMRDANEIGIAGVAIEYAGARSRRPQDGTPPASGRLTTDQRGDFHTWLPADPAYADPTYAITARAPASAAWSRIPSGTGYWSGGTIPKLNDAYTFTLHDRDDVTRLDFGFVCSATNTGGVTAAYWSDGAGRAILAPNEPRPGAPQGGGGGGGGGGGQGGRPASWRAALFSNTRHLVDATGTRVTFMNGTFDEAYAQLRTYLRSTSTNAAHQASVQLAITSLNVVYGTQNGAASVSDPVSGEWVSINTLLTRVSTAIAANPNPAAGTAAGAQLERYRSVLEQLNRNTATVTPATPAGCSAAS
jgi:hypothetical protein